MYEILEAVVLITLLFFAALTAACEIAMVAISRLRLRKLSSEGSRTAKAIVKILEIPERFFSTILVANNIIDTLIAVIVTAMVIRFFKFGSHWEILLATVIASALIIIAEVTAKTIAAQYPEKVSFLLARPVQVFIFIFSPVVNAFAFASRKILSLLGVRGKNAASIVTQEEIRMLIKVGEEEGVLRKEESSMLARVFDFSGTLVRKVMTPKKDIVSIDVAAKFDDILMEASESGYSRILVHKDSPDNIVGIINTKDLLSLSCNRDLIVLQDIIYPATFVPDTKKVSELLKEFQKGHTHLAVVTGSSGKVEGIVTIEDLLEEIVGEIEDEYDVRFASPKETARPSGSA